MSDLSVKVEFTDKEIKALIEILRYSLGMCPIEGISYEVIITRDEVQNLISKLEKASQ